MGAIVEFLIKPKNIGTAFDIYEHFSSAIDHLHLEFWRRLLELIQERLRENNRDGVWRAELDHDIRRFLGTEYATLGIYPCQGNAVGWAFWIEKQRENNRVRISYGFGFYPTEKGKRATRPKPARDLIAEINAPGNAWISYNNQIADGWVARRSFDFDLRSRESMIQLANGDGLEQRVANALFNDLFDHYHETLEEINRQLQQRDANEARRPRRRNR
jgi:hypothetical protein